MCTLAHISDLQLFYGSPEPVLMWTRGGERDNQGQKEVQVVSQDRRRSLPVSIARLIN